MSTTMTVECPSCDAAFPVDPAKVPEGGVRTQCTVCETQFRVDAPAESWTDTTDTDDAFWTPESEDAGTADDTVAGGGAVAEEAVVEPDELPEPEAVEAALDEAEIDAVEEAEAVEETEPVEAAELEVEVSDAIEVEPEVESAGSMDALDDWVVETEETGAFGAADETEIELEDLDTVRDEQGDEAYTAFMADEVMLSADELDRTVEEVDVEPPALEGDETPELPPLEVAEDVPTPEMAAETVLEDLDEVETVFEPEEAAEVSADEPMGEAYVEPAEGEVDAVQEIEAMAPEIEVEPEPEPAEPAPVESEPAPEPEEAPAPTGFQFGKRDPHDKARRLARVLVSDMITYNPERHARALENDSLKEDFEEEIGKSWAEYVEQVGQELAESTSYWNDALNEILARGRPLF